MISPSRWPKISIVIPCFNRRGWIAEAISSAVNQTYEHFEVIVVDDGSTDGSWDVIETFEPKIRAIKMENRGVSAARNKGVELASGNFIVFLDSDDLLEPEALLNYGDASQMEPMEIRIGHRRMIDEGGNVIEARDRIVGFERGCVLNAVDILSVWAPNWACLIPKPLFVAAGGFDEKISLSEDYDLNLRMLRCGARFQHVGELTYQWRVHDHPKLTRKVPQQRYQQMLDIFLAAWNAYEDEFRKDENRLQRVRFSRWLWAAGRTCFRAGFPDVGDSYTRLALEIAGSEARTGSWGVLLAYRVFSPYAVERATDFAKRIWPLQ